jgi:hypothetical protein
MAIARTFVGFCVLTFVAGAAMALVPSTRELGIAVVVGSIFSFGSFVTQFWAVVVQNERQAHDLIWGEPDRRQARHLIRRHGRLLDRLDQLEARHARDTSV